MKNKSTFENDITNPLVSVIVPSYNHKDYISECIESIVNQTYKNFELIVIDDGSTDNSIEIINKLKVKYNFKFVVQENIGLSATLNKGIKEFSNGKYITFCASDDFWCINKLELQIDFMEKNSEIPMCYGLVNFIDEKSEILKRLSKQNHFFKGGDLFNDILLFKLHPPVNYFFRKSVFDIVGYYDEELFAEDYYMNLKISSKFNIGFIDQYLSYYRVDSSFKKVIRFKKVSESHLKTIEAYKNHYLYKSAKSMVYLRNFTVFAGYQKHKKLGLENAIKARRYFFKKEYIFALAKLIIVWR